MRLVIYRIVCPFILGGIVFLLLSIHHRHVWAKQQNRRKPLNNKGKYFSLLFLILSLVSFSFAGYSSLDVLLNDPAVDDGVYLKYHRGDIITSELLFDADGQILSLEIFAADMQKYGFEPGRTYEITYAKRTGMLISANASN